MENAAYGYSRPGQRYADCAKVGRREALEIGQNVYWSGKPCAQGHVSWRYVSNYSCVICQAHHVNNHHARKPPVSVDEKIRRKIEYLREDRELERQLRADALDYDIDEPGGV